MTDIKFRLKALRIQYGHKKRGKMNNFYWLTTNSFKVFFKVFYGHKVYGLEHFYNGRGIIAPNHTSFFDPPMIAASWPEDASFLARKSLFTRPVIGTMIRHLNSYPVNGTTQDLGSIKLVCKLLSENKKVVIFPEGIRSFDGQLGPIKSGIGMLAIRCQSPIIPAYLSGCYEVWNRHKPAPKLKGKTTCVFGSPIDWQQFSHLDKKEAQEQIAQAVSEAIEKLKVWYESGAVGSPP
jgi:1-acyl-sn-glycerol-3-phosphate acyltransferase